MSKVNVYGSFAQALLFSGSVSIPQYLLNHYVDLGLTDQEMMVLIHIISAGEPYRYLSPEALSSRMSASAREIEEVLGKMVERKLISIENYWDSKENKWDSRYSIVGLLDELADHWAIDQVKQFEKQQKLANAKPNIGSQDHPSGKSIFQTFEHELGRPLTEMELDYIKSWQQQYSSELINEALRRGVSAGIRNFRYLDSILREWEKKGLRTINEVLADDAYFQSRQEEKNKPKSRTTRKPSSGKYDNFYL